jgi:tetratricopeptide (TPR) repeat protein
VTEGGPPVSNATPPGGNRAIGGGTPRPAGSPVAIPTPPAATPAPPAPPAPPPGHHTERKPVLVNAPAGAAGPGAGDTLDGGAIEALLDAGRHDEALAAFKVMTKKNPADRSARAGIELCEGLRAMAGRDRLEAAQRFEAVLEIDPANERAARELADMRRQATNERKGLLSRLMGKKE